ncbi:hypothetical protein TNCV_3105691 [Trichonephila clavipes]|nr:hypothetical protein TNCV_3105691 [Trichonephila clavipes]
MSHYKATRKRLLVNFVALNLVQETRSPELVSISSNYHTTPNGGSLDRFNVSQPLYTADLQWHLILNPRLDNPCCVLVTSRKESKDSEVDFSDF